MKAEEQDPKGVPATIARLTREPGATTRLGEALGRTVSFMSHVKSGKISNISTALILRCKDKEARAALITARIHEYKRAIERLKEELLN